MPNIDANGAGGSKVQRALFVYLPALAILTGLAGWMLEVWSTLGIAGAILLTILSLTLGIAVRGVASAAPLERPSSGTIGALETLAGEITVGDCSDRSHGKPIVIPHGRHPVTLVYEQNGGEPELVELVIGNGDSLAAAVRFEQHTITLDSGQLIVLDSAALDEQWAGQIRDACQGDYTLLHDGLGRLRGIVLVPPPGPGTCPITIRRTGQAAELRCNFRLK